MKLKLFVAALAIFFCGASLAEDPAILRIRAEYQAIQTALPSFKELSASVVTSEGGDATAYMDEKGDIRLLKTLRYFETLKVYENYYYKDGALMFALVTLHRYNVPPYITPEVAKGAGIEPFDPKKTRIVEERYYFDQGKMIRWTRDKENMPRGSEEFRAAQAQVVGASNEMLALFKK